MRRRAVTAGKDGDGFLCDLPETCPVAEVCLPGRNVPCLDMGRAHDETLLLCDALERIADGLPHKVERALCLAIAARIVPMLKDSHAYEEEVVFPAFAAAAALPAVGDASIRRLKAEHVEDECAAQDLADVLFAIGHGSAIDNPEALGFMLRAFFETTRRHIAFEREHVMPVLARGIPG
jgi:hemerythrin-like domain-containing protein